MYALVDQLGGAKGDVELAIPPALKDPVRVHEKAMDDYVHDFDDWADDVVIPEACVLDMMRGTAVCNVAKIMVGLQSRLDEGIPELAVGSETVGISSVRNKIRFTEASGNLDPTHHRFIINNLYFTQVSPFSYHPARTPPWRPP